MESLCQRFVLWWAQFLPMIHKGKSMVGFHLYDKKTDSLWEKSLASLLSCQCHEHMVSWSQNSHLMARRYTHTAEQPTQEGKTQGYKECGSHLKSLIHEMPLELLTSTLLCKLTMNISINQATVHWMFHYLQPKASWLGAGVSIKIKQPKIPLVAWDSKMNMFPPVLS